MFDLEQAIAEWRKQMLAAGIEMPVPLEELEIHLREEIELQTGSSRSEAEAFQAAIQKIGTTHTIHKEFEKIGAFRSGFNWKFFTVLFSGYVALYPLLVGSLVFIFRNGAFSEMNTRQQILSLMSAVVFSLLAWGAQSSCGKIPMLRTNRARDAIFVPVMLWLVIFAYVIMPHVGLAESQRAVVSLWGFAPFGIVLGWIWGFATAARKTTASAGA